MVRHIAQLAEWQTTKAFDYSGRAQTAEPRFQKGECGIFIGSSATRADIKANSKFEVGYGMLPYWPDVEGAPQNSIIGGATLWVLRDRPRAEYKGVAKFFGFLSRPEVQAAWHQNTGYLPVTRAAFDLTRAQGFYDRNPGAAISIEQITLKPPTVNSRGVRLGSFVLIRDVIDDELEQAFSAGSRRGPRLIPPLSAATGCFASSSAPTRTGSCDGRCTHCRACRVSKPSRHGAPTRRSAAGGARHRARPWTAARGSAGFPTGTNLVVGLDDRLILKIFPVPARPVRVGADLAGAASRKAQRPDSGNRVRR